MVRPLMLGETCLDDYVSEPVELDENKKEKIDELIKRIEERGVLNIEKKNLQLLKNQSRLLDLKSRYKQLNPSFLSMSNIAYHKGDNFSVPKFSIYYGSMGGFNNKFSILFGYDTDYYKGYSGLDVLINNNMLPEIFNLSLLKTTDFFKKCNSYEVCESRPNGPDVEKVYRFKNIPKEIRKRFNVPRIHMSMRSRPMISLTSYFNGILPQETFERLKEAEKYFGTEDNPRKNLYLIMETKPEEWNVSEVIKTDPLLVGVHDNNCFLIDKFDTTSLENYVSKEFTF